MCGTLWIWLSFSSRCHFRITKDSLVCGNVNCPPSANPALGDFTKVYDIRVSLSDETGTITNCFLTSDVAEKLLECTVKFPSVYIHSSMHCFIPAFSPFKHLFSTKMFHKISWTVSGVAACFSSCNTGRCSENNTDRVQLVRWQVTMRGIQCHLAYTRPSFLYWSVTCTNTSWEIKQDVLSLDWCRVCASARWSFDLKTMLLRIFYRSM